jgi:hypothetical protein
LKGSEKKANWPRNKQPSQKYPSYITGHNGDKNAQLSALEIKANNDRAAKKPPRSPGKGKKPDKTEPANEPGSHFESKINFKTSKINHLS